MKKSLFLAAAGLSTILLLNGCIGVSLGGGSKTTEGPKATVGQQLTDLQKAKASGAITEAEYQAQKEKILQGK